MRFAHIRSIALAMLIGVLLGFTSPSASPPIGRLALHVFVSPRNNPCGWPVMLIDPNQQMEN